MCDETWDARFYYFIQPLPSLDAINFAKCVFRKSGNIKILARASRSSGRGQQSRAAVRCPCQQHLRRRFSNLSGDCQNHWIFERPRLYSMTQWSERQKYNTLLLAEFQKLRFRQIRM